MTLAGIFLLIAILGLEEIEYQSIAISPVNFGLFAMPISIALITLVNSLLSDALMGMRFINDKNSVMLVGMFPWSIVKYARIGWVNNFLSLLTRFAMSFHPVVYLHYWNWIEDDLLYTTILFLITLSILSTWTFILSQSSQKPNFFLNEPSHKPEAKVNH